MPKTKTVVMEPLEKRAYTARELAAMYGMSAAYFHLLIRRGDLDVIRAGRAVRVPVASVQSWERASTEKRLDPYSV